MDWLIKGEENDRKINKYKLIKLAYKGADPGLKNRGQ